MNLTTAIKAKMKDDPLFTFNWFERLLAIICVFIPVVLKLFDNCDTKETFRSSISDYVYMEHVVKGQCISYSFIFGIVFCMAAMLFIFNGVVYLRNEDKLNLNKNGKWYNIVLGVSLLLVAFFPHNEFPIPHYIFAITFFVGNSIVFGFSRETNKLLSRSVGTIFALLTVASYVLYYFKILGTLFYAEWISLFIIGIHFILETF